MVAAAAASAAFGGAAAPQPVWGSPAFAGELPRDAAEVAELITVDLNGDGLRDVVVGPTNVSLGDEVSPAAPVFLLNRGNGRFIDATQQLFAGPAPAIEWDREILTADFNRDGRPDIFIADHGHVNDSDASAGRSGAQQHLILSTADGHLVDASANLPQQRSFTHSAAVADVNGDGAPDIFENNLDCCSDDHVRAQLLLNDGTGHFAVEPNGIQGMITNSYGSDSSYACVLVDVNGDGAPDLVLGGSENPGANASQVLLNEGHGHFSFFETLPPSLGPPNNAFVIDIRALDVNGDGANDLVFGESRNDPWYQGTAIQILVNDGHGHFTDETSTRFPDEPTTDNWPERVLVEDVDGDGHPDLTVLFRTGNTPTTIPPALYLNRGGIFQKAKAPQVRYGAAGGAIGYVEGDGPHALFSVEYQNLGGRSIYFIAPQFVTPKAPSGVHAARVRGGVRITWSRVAQATHYEIRRNGRLIATTSSNSFLDRHPTGRAVYTVRSTNPVGTSHNSAPAAPKP